MNVSMNLCSYYQQYKNVHFNSIPSYLSLKADQLIPSISMKIKYAWIAFVYLIFILYFYLFIYMYCIYIFRLKQILLHVHFSIFIFQLYTNRINTQNEFRCVGPIEKQNINKKNLLALILPIANVCIEWANIFGWMEWFFSLIELCFSQF